MRSGGALASLGVFLLLGSPASAQEALLDQWLETYQAERKVAWEHLRVWSLPGEPGGDAAAGFRIQREVWIPLESGVIQVEERGLANSAGALHEHSRHEVWPDGRETSHRVAPQEGGSVYRWTPRGASSSTEAPCPGPLLAWRLLGLRHRAGAAIEGERHAYLLETPGVVARAERIGIELTAAGLKAELGPKRVLFGPDGELLRVDFLERVASVSLPCTQAEAEDPARRRATPRGLEPGGVLRFPLYGVTLSPPSPEWLLTRRALAGGLTLGLSHPSGTSLTLLHLPEATPTRDRVTSLHIASELVASPPAPRLELSDPRLTRFRGQVAVVFRWRHRAKTIPPSEGEAALLRGREGGLLVLASSPPGGVSPQDAVRGITPLESDWETITLDEEGLRFAIPSRWEELEPGDYAAPDRLARLTVERVEIPLLTKPRAYQRQLLGNLSRLVARAETDDRPGQLAGRDGRVVTIRGRVRGAEAGPPARIHCAIFMEGRVMLAVTAVAIGTGRSGAELDDAWASVQWKLR